MKWFTVCYRKNFIYLTNNMYMISINIDKENKYVKLSFLQDPYIGTNINVLSEIEAILYIKNCIGRIEAETRKLKCIQYYSKSMNNEKNELVNYLIHLAKNLNGGD